ncbi:hypothetical protein GDO86_019630 [Hymenochirus boettgeri]|uniref:Uncharacterized protein n=1 Tax=Hymenochirus boettgeri TaxID=247094 RepID=A0A8T2IGJ6_9PIPI|nr:hypothetical protein GDO86_019630 [Hymenochirus boettgeri]
MIWLRLSLLALCVRIAVLCPAPCGCTLTEHKGLIVNCSFKHLTQVPDLPFNTIRLYLHNNSLRSLSTGSLDHLMHLEEIDMSHNPWFCDCNIRYLRNWLGSQDRVRNTHNVRCAAPESVSQIPLFNLSGNEMGSGCRTWWPIKCSEFAVRDLFLICPSILILVILSCFLKVTKRLACRVAINSSPSFHQSTSRK